MTASADVCLLVVRLSDSFGDFWPALARDIGVALADWTPAADQPPASDAAVVIAAGGREPGGTPSSPLRSSRWPPRPTSACTTLWDSRKCGDSRPAS